MTLDELRAVTAPIADELQRLSTEAEQDEFAPWIVEALARAAVYARLDSSIVRSLQHEIEGDLT